MNKGIAAASAVPILKGGYEVMIQTFKSGCSLRRLNNAEFEMILPGGEHLLVDPWLDRADIFPAEVGLCSAYTYSF